MNKDDKTATAIRDIATADWLEETQPPGFMHDVNQIGLRTGSYGAGFVGAIGVAIHNWFKNKN